MYRTELCDLILLIKQTSVMRLTGTEYTTSMYAFLESSSFVPKMAKNIYNLLSAPWLDMSQHPNGYLL